MITVRYEHTDAATCRLKNLKNQLKT